MRWQRTTALLLAGSVGLSSLGPLTGCESLPGDEKTQGAVIGGVGGAAAGAAIAKDNRVLGGLIGGALGAGGGYLIGAQVAKHNDKSKEQVQKDAEAAVKKAETNPATADDVKKSDTADLNDDGFVTVDEVVAMHKAGLPDKEMIKRLQRTQQYFELTPEQENYLREHEISDGVVLAMRGMGPTDGSSARTASGKQKPDDSNVDLRTDPNR
jgi:hypothetical protein